MSLTLHVAELLAQLDFSYFSPHFFQYGRKIIHLGGSFFFFFRQILHFDKQLLILCIGKNFRKEKI